LRDRVGSNPTALKFFSRFFLNASTRGSDELIFSRFERVFVGNKRKTRNLRLSINVVLISTTATKIKSCSKKGIDTTTRSNEEMLLRRCVVMETRVRMMDMAGRISRLGLQRRMFRYDGIPRDSPALPIEGIFLNWKRGTDE
jgi:hypothetical protein